MYINLVEYLQDHGLPAKRDGKQIQTLKIQTLNQYMDKNGVYHSEPIRIPATWQTVREFLGY